MILRCREPNRAAPERLCGGMIGAVPDDWVAAREIGRYEDAGPGACGLRCQLCRRIFEVRPANLLQGAA